MADLHIMAARGLLLRRQADAAYRSDFEQAGVGMAQLDLDACVIRANQALCDMLGYTPSEMVGLSFPSISHPEDAAEIRALRSHAMSGEKRALRVEKRYLRKDGSVIWASVNSAVIQDAEGNPGYVLSTIEDITERKRAEEKLRDSEKKYRAIAESISDVVWVLDPLTLRFTYASPSVEKLTGFTADETMAQEMHEVLVPESAQAARELITRQVVNCVSGDGPTGRVEVVEAEMNRKDGSTVWVEVTAVIQPNEDTGHMEVHGTTRDISERRQAAQELRREKDRYQATFEHAAIGIAEVTPQGRWLRVNQTLCDILGYSSKELSHLSFAEITHPDDVGRTVGALQPLRDDEEETYRTEKRYVRKDGAAIWVDVSVAAIRGEDGSLAYQVTAVQDISDRKRAEEQLATAFSSLIEVVSRMAETRDPYTAGHQRRVCELSLAIAKQMGMPAADVEEIRVAALVHDIGKMSIPAEILSKPGALSPVEFELVKGHCKAGYDILQASNMPGQVPEIVYQHHERCDGSGYPRGLSADELLPQTRVIMVADVVEAMMSHRPYRPGLGVEAALGEIERGSGAQYSSDAVDACLGVFREGFTFSESS